MEKGEYFKKALECKDGMARFKIRRHGGMDAFTCRRGSMELGDDVFHVAIVFRDYRSVGRRCFELDDSFFSLIEMYFQPVLLSLPAYPKLFL